MKSNNSFYQNISSLLATNQPFVLFRLPGRQSQLWVQNTLPLQTSTNPEKLLSSTGFLFAPFISSIKVPAILLRPDSIYHEGEPLPITANFPMNKEPISTEDEKKIESNKDTYLNNLGHLINILKDGEVEKVVISRSTKVERLTNDLLMKVYTTLVFDYPQAFVYLAHLPPYGTWMGATPETLISCQGSHCHTMALAGTRVFGSPEKWGTKETEEQAIVSRYILEIVQKHQVQNLQVSEPFTSTTGNLEHLCTRFEFQLPEPDALRLLINDLHPTPAVCGFPLEDALKLIDRFEAHHREYYTGYLGPVHFDDQTHLFVNLRCMKITPSRMVLYTGGGITRDSVAENEWHETSAKAHSMLSVIEKFRNLAV
ncbi:MAG: chorismate-binding protein [Bacteroidales bacterium]|nr:chorismate-binding protein [Bacteroidales bacterium]MDZ4205047.1 chorismate-binding protein [Bacteroidales bacterium]